MFRTSTIGQNCPRKKKYYDCESNVFLLVVGTGVADMTRKKTELVGVERANREKTRVNRVSILDWLMLSARISSYGCKREVWRARKKPNSR